MDGVCRRLGHGMILLMLLGAMLLVAPQAAIAQVTLTDSADRVLQARAILQKYCTACHTGKGDSKLDILDYAQLTTKNRPRPLITPGQPNQSQLIDLVEDGSMPPAGRDRPTADERAMLKSWVQERAGEFPRQFDETYVLNQILADVKKQPDPQAVRYLSFAHQIANADREGGNAAARPSLATWRLALSQWMEKLTKDPSAKLVALDPAGTIFRMPAAAMGWTEARLKPRPHREDASLNLPPGAPTALSAFDLLLLEYPNGALDFDIKATMELVTAYLIPLNQVRPIIYLQADWLVKHLVQSTYREEIRQTLGLDAPNKRKLPAIDTQAVAYQIPAPAERRMPILPIDALSLPTWQPPANRFTVKFEQIDAKTGLAAKSFKPGPKKFALTLTPSRSIHVEVAQHYCDHAIHLVDFEKSSNQFLKGVTRRVPVDGADSFDVGEGEGRERAIVFASEGPPTPGIIYSTGEKDYPVERLVHLFPKDRLRPMGTVGTMFDPNGVVKHSLEYQVEPIKP